MPQRLEPMSPGAFYRLYDGHLCPEAVDSHRVDNPHGICQWCGRKVEPNQAERAALAEWYRIRDLAKENS